MAYGVFESVNMRSTHAGGRIFDAVAAFDVENGTVGYLDGLSNGETTIYVFKKGLAEGKAPVIVDQPAWDVDDSKTSNQRKDKFIVKQGTPFRVRKLYNDDKFGISIDCVALADREGFAVGKTVTVDENGKFVVVTAAEQTEQVGDPGETEAETVDNQIEGLVIRKRLQGAEMVTTAHNYGYQRYIYVIEVTKLA